MLECIKECAEGVCHIYFHVYFQFILLAAFILDVGRVMLGRGCTKLRVFVYNILTDLFNKVLYTSTIRLSNSDFFIYCIDSLYNDLTITLVFLSWTPQSLHNILLDIWGTLWQLYKFVYAINWWIVSAMYLFSISIDSCSGNYHIWVIDVRSYNKDSYHTTSHKPSTLLVGVHLVHATLAKQQTPGIFWYLS